MCCPNDEGNRRVEDKTAELRDAYNITGGTIAYMISNVPPGLGELCFEKLGGEAWARRDVHTRFKIRSGFVGAEMNGSVHNDPFNNSGGIQGGISNGMPNFFGVAFKPPATIRRRRGMIELARVF